VGPLGQGGTIWPRGGPGAELRGRLGLRGGVWLVLTGGAVGEGLFFHPKLPARAGGPNDFKPMGGRFCGFTGK